MLELTDRCPTWCRDHQLDDDHIAAHTAVIGFAGPLEVSLQCYVLATQADPVTELQIRHLGDTSAEQTMTLPLDTDVDQLAGLLRRAAETDRSR